jgi:hypothetical protein
MWARAFSPTIQCMAIVKGYVPLSICATFIVKEYVPLSIMDYSWVQRLVMWQNGKIHSPIHKQLIKKHIPFVLIKCMDCYVLHVLAQCDTILSHLTYGWIKLGLTPLCSLWTFWIEIGYIAMSLLIYLKM